MAAATQPVPALLTLDEYLHTTYRPDCEFVDGHLEERNVGGTKHGLLQSLICIWFANHYGDWNLVTINEQRTRVAATRVRLPDLSVILDDDALLEDPRTTPAFIAIEILSPDDRISRVIPRLKDFLAMGVQHVWLIDPIERIAYTVVSGGALKLVEGDKITIDGSPVHLDLPSLFTWFDSRSTRLG